MFSHAIVVRYKSCTPLRRAIAPGARSMQYPCWGIRNRPYRFKWKRAPTAERNRSAFKFRNAFGASRAPLPLFVCTRRLASGEPAAVCVGCFRRPLVVILGRARHRRVEGRGSSAGLVEDAAEPSALLTLDPGTVLLLLIAHGDSVPRAGRRARSTEWRRRLGQRRA